MIQIVKKIYTDNEFNYEVTFVDGTISFVPHNKANRHYQEILEWVENGGVIVDNGA